MLQLAQGAGTHFLRHSGYSGRGSLQTGRHGDSGGDTTVCPPAGGSGGPANIRPTGAWPGATAPLCTTGRQLLPGLLLLCLVQTVSKGSVCTQLVVFTPCHEPMLMRFASSSLASGTLLPSLPKQSGNLVPYMQCSQMKTGCVMENKNQEYMCS